MGQNQPIVKKKDIFEVTTRERPQSWGARNNPGSMANSFEEDFLRFRGNPGDQGSEKFQPGSAQECQGLVL